MSNREESRGGRSGERDRKSEHIRLALEDGSQDVRSPFDDYRLLHRALPEIDLAAIRTEAMFLGKRLSAPILISCMTGGTDEAMWINRNLALAAESSGVALGVGSLRKAIEEPQTVGSFEVRQYAPTVPVLANLGAVQLNYGYGAEECRAAVEMIDADALVLHLNPLQEAIQPEGQGDFSDLARKIGRVVEQLDWPVIVKEVGAGLSREDVQRLHDSGVRMVDCAGRGGTSWAWIEGQRAEDRDLGSLFADWGISTPQALLDLREFEDLYLIGSGGVRSGLDVAKAIALGADLVGMAQPFLGPAMESVSKVEEKVNRTVRELRIAMFCIGAGTLDELAAARVERSGPGNAGTERVSGP